MKQSGPRSVRLAEGALVQPLWRRRLVAMAARRCIAGHSLAARSRPGRAYGSLRHLPARLSRIEVLVSDDSAMAPLNEGERREISEIFEDLYQAHATIPTSQMAVSRWHEQTGDPTIADGIL